MDKQTFVSVLKEFGFKKMPWDKCPQGYKESNYQCFCTPFANMYAEVYLSDPYPYMWIVGDGMEGGVAHIGGKHFNEAEELHTFLLKAILK
jgi:hypothetical protein